MASGLPLWIRLLFAVDAAVSAAARAVSAVRDEALYAFVAPERRDDITAALYAPQSTYAPGGSIFRAGLFDWERRLISMPPFPSKGTLLIGGAGSGREVVVLRDMGYDIVAFEPSEPLVRLGQQGVAERAGAVLVCASYADVALAARGENGRLASVLAHRRIDGVILGWGSLAHVVEQEERRMLLRSMRALAPEAPLILSFLSGPASANEARLGTVRLVARKAFRLVGAKFVAKRGDRFMPHAGFYHEMSASDIETLAGETGYSVSHLDMQPYPHAMLVSRRE